MSSHALDESSATTSNVLCLLKEVRELRDTRVFSQRLVFGVTNATNGRRTHSVSLHLLCQAFCVC